MIIKKHYQGFSLVELMVAMLLGLLITGAALQLFLANQQSFALQQALSRIQEDGQLFVRFLVRDLRQAGLEMDDVVSSYPQGVKFVTTQGKPGSSNGANYDRLTIAYHGVSDCEGGAVAGGSAAEIVNTYFVNDESELVCDGSVSGGDGVVLLEGVQAFEVMYGIDTNKNGYANAGQYVSAGDLGGKEAVAVRFAILLKNDSLSLPESEGTQKFYVLQKEITAPQDQAVRRVFMSTVKLRNYSDWDAI
ncbi:PilW family protein [Alcanivorax sp.]|uniref:PilW family protein n=1 Tax=Alcanivorax sp. TaxID=1872427 RepID=UPI000C0EB3FF|nr:PilW family protein [Alcanivorax sp.]PHR67090.1 MAG: prepilin-type cleavage/methylation domain-containing protein [Alcanivorax sp.]